MDKQLNIPFDEELSLENKYKIMITKPGCIGCYIMFYINWKHINTKIKDLIHNIKNIFI